MIEGNTLIADTPKIPKINKISSLVEFFEIKYINKTVIIKTPKNSKINLGIFINVLDRYKNGQTNLDSKAAREMIAAEIEAVLISNEQVKQITRDLYKGEG